MKQLKPLLPQLTLPALNIALLALAMLASTAQAGMQCDISYQACDSACSLKHFNDDAALSGCASKCLAEKGLCLAKDGAEDIAEGAADLAESAADSAAALGEDLAEKAGDLTQDAAKAAKDAGAKAWDKTKSFIEGFSNDEKAEQAAQQATQRQPSI